MLDFGAIRRPPPSESCPPPTHVVDASIVMYGAAECLMQRDASPYRTCLKANVNLMVRSLQRCPHNEKWETPLHEFNQARLDVPRCPIRFDFANNTRANGSPQAPSRHVHIG